MGNMGNIKCSISKMESTVSELKTCRQEIDSYCEDLEKELNSISEAWQGADATKYIDKMKDDYLFSFDGLLEGLDQCIKYLEDNVPVKYEEDDKKWAGKSIG